MDKNNRFMKIIRDAEALRLVRRRERAEQMKARKPEPGSIVDYTPKLESGIPYERREYLHKLVKEVLSKD
jgi:hypothetical protein